MPRIDSQLEEKNSTDERIESRLLETRTRKKSLADVHAFQKGLVDLGKSHYQHTDEVNALRQLNEVSETTRKKELEILDHLELTKKNLTQ